MIINPVSGGGTQLAYSWVNAASYAALPATPPENTIGLITSTAVPNVYFQNDTVIGMSAGDVVIRQGIVSSNPFNILPSGKLFINASGAYQYNGSLWVSIPAYLFNGTAWVLLCELYFDSGTLYPSIGGFSTHKVSGTTVSYANSGGQASVSVASAAGWAYSFYQINLTPISTLWFRARTNDGNQISFGVIPTHNSFTGAIYLNVGSAALQTRGLDVSGATGMYYLFFGINAVTTRTGYLQKCWSE